MFNQKLFPTLQTPNNYLIRIFRYGLDHWEICTNEKHYQNILNKEHGGCGGTVWKDSQENAVEIFKMLIQSHKELTWWNTVEDYENYEDNKK